MDAVLTPELLLRAYCQGVFPMAESRDASDIFWVDPKKRGVLPLDGFHISRSLRRRIRTSGWQITINTAFEDVVEGCADREDTWINDTIFDLYMSLHAAGFAHALEVWEDGILVGGVYGVAINGGFFGESMFSRRTDASKLALAYLVDHLRRGGFVLFDTQFLTDHLRSLGAVEIPRETYHQRLETALSAHASFADTVVEQDAQALLQRSTQTS